MVKLIPLEDMIQSKVYIQYKERFDGADVINLILRYGKTINWNILLEKMEPNWNLLLEHIVAFYFVYPKEKDHIPPHVIHALLKRFHRQIHDKTATDKITKGLLISSQYKITAAKWGIKPVT